MVDPDTTLHRRSRSWPAPSAAVAVGIILLIGVARSSSATYDEVAYLEIGSEWWRHGHDERITRMGSPLTFWKLQQAPVLWILDRTGRSDWIDHPIAYQSRLLPWIRIGGCWIWILALVLTACWARMEHGASGMVWAAWIFALSPNLLAHGALATMEMPLVAATSAIALLSAQFLRTGHPAWFWAAAAMTGLAFSLKFTAVLFPPLLGLSWWNERCRAGEPTFRSLRSILGRMTPFVVVMLAANVLVTGFQRIPLSEQRGDHPVLQDLVGARATLASILETPLPQDWVGFARQLHHQRSGGPGYLLGERGDSGWWYYYLVGLAVKTPLSVLLMIVARALLIRRTPTTPGDRLAMSWILATLVIVSMGSSRNYGVRYVLFLAPAAIVWISGLASSRSGRMILAIGLLGQVLAVAGIHPHELSYFNVIAGGPEGGKHILADSNLDWGQGARSLQRLQSDRPELRDLTLFAFGDTDPAHYGVVGTRYLIDAQGPPQSLPDEPGDVRTAYVAISRSLQFGPWGPSGYFDSLRSIRPLVVTDDHTIAVYRKSDLARDRRDRYETEIK